MSLQCNYSTQNANTPVINSVVFAGDALSFTLTITGTGFGTVSKAYLESIHDGSVHWVQAANINGLVFSYTEVHAGTYKLYVDVDGKGFAAY